MSLKLRNQPDVFEIDGPASQYLEIPLEYFATPNGELEPPTHPDACRLVQRVNYRQFEFSDSRMVRVVIERITAKLKSVGGGYIWWRQRPRHDEVTGRILFQLGTTPKLPTEWWLGLSLSAGNVAAPLDE